MKEIEYAIGTVFKKLIAEYEKNGVQIDDSVQHAARSKAMMAVTEEYVDSARYDEIFEYLLDQWDGGDGYPYFEVISDKLLDLQETERFFKMWNALLSYRKAENYKSEALKAMQHYLRALEKLGDKDAISKLKEEIEQFASGVKPQFPTTDRRQMSQDIFWDIIRRAKEDAGLPALRAQQLQMRLLRLPPEGIEKFETIFQAMLDKSYTWDLWALAYMYFGGCSEDGFSSFRAWLISEGKEAFEAIVENPEAIIELRLKLYKLEPLLYACSEAYQLKSAKSLPDVGIVLQEPSGQEWKEDESELRSRYPKIWEYVSSL